MTWPVRRKSESLKRAVRKAQEFGPVYTRDAKAIGGRWPNCSGAHTGSTFSEERRQHLSESKKAWWKRWHEEHGL